VLSNSANWVTGIRDRVIINNAFFVKRYIRKNNRSEVETLHAGIYIVG